jgi:hypothetical protein
MLDESRSKLFHKHKKSIIISIISILVIAVISIVSVYEYKNYKFNTNVSVAQKSFNSDKFNDAKKYYNQALTYKNDSSIKEKIKLCDDMEFSLVSFQDGNNYYNNKDYLKAYNSFKIVKSEDKRRYKTAQNKEKESLQLYSNQMIQSSQDLANKDNLNNAISQLNTLLATNLNDDNAKKLLAQYQAKQQKELDDAKQAEQVKEQQKAQKQQQDIINNAKSIIRVQSITTSEPNFAGGVDLHIIWTNKSSKTIKYVTFQVVPYNAVGDPQSSEIGGTSSFGGKVTGPINPGQTYGGDSLWENAWYNSTIKTAKLTEIDITYMDDSTDTIDSNTVGYVQY